jgi:hypothetical protein
MKNLRALDSSSRTKGQGDYKDSGPYRQAQKINTNFKMTKRNTNQLYDK